MKSKYRQALLDHLRNHDHYNGGRDGFWLVRYNVPLHLARLTQDEIYSELKKVNSTIPELETISWDGNARVENAIARAVHGLFCTSIYKTPSPEASKQYGITQKPLDVEFGLLGRTGARLVVEKFKGHSLGFGFLDTEQNPEQFDAQSCRQLLALLQTWETEFNQIRVCRMIEDYAQEDMLECLLATAAEKRESAYWAARDVITEA
jgi:hypothetical protein